MKKEVKSMKKLTSILLSAIIMLTSVVGFSLTAYAGGWTDQAIDIEFDTVYNASPSLEDASKHQSSFGVRSDYYYDAFKFSVLDSGKITLNMEAQSKYFLPLDYESRIDYLIYSTKNLDEEFKVDYNIVKAGFSSARNIYYGKYEWNLPAGEYYMLFEYDYNDTWGFDQKGECDFSVSYTPNIATPSNVKAYSKKTKTVKTSWNGVSQTNQYQVYLSTNKKFTSCKKANVYKKKSFTFKALKKNKTYYVKVRAYKNVDGKRVYGKWSDVKRVKCK